MRIKTLKGLVGVLVLAGAGFVLAACNTTKATIDSSAQFTSSTSPSNWINPDGVIQESQKTRVFAAVAFENLEQDIARGNGEYLESLAVLMKIPAAERAEFRMHSQSNYSRLFATDLRTAEKLLATVIGKKEDLGVDSQRLK
jgi:hypothetical protein